MFNHRYVIFFGKILRFINPELINEIHHLNYRSGAATTPEKELVSSFRGNFGFASIEASNSQLLATFRTERLKQSPRRRFFYSYIFYQNMRSVICSLKLLSTSNHSILSTSPLVQGKKVWIQNRMLCFTLSYFLLIGRFFIKTASAINIDCLIP